MEDPNDRSICLQEYDIDQMEPDWDDPVYRDYQNPRGLVCRSCDYTAALFRREGGIGLKCIICARPTGRFYCGSRREDIQGRRFATGCRNGQCLECRGPDEGVGHCLPTPTAACITSANGWQGLPGDLGAIIAEYCVQIPLLATPPLSLRHVYRCPGVEWAREEWVDYENVGWECDITRIMVLKELVLDARWFRTIWCSCKWNEYRANTVCQCVCNRSQMIAMCNALGLNHNDYSHLIEYDMERTEHYTADYNPPRGQNLQSVLVRLIDAESYIDRRAWDESGINQGEEGGMYLGAADNLCQSCPACLSAPHPPVSTGSVKSTWDPEEEQKRLKRLHIWELCIYANLTVGSDCEVCIGKAGKAPGFVDPRIDENRRYAENARGRNWQYEPGQKSKFEMMRIEQLMKTECLQCEKPVGR